MAWGCRVRRTKILMDSVCVADHLPLHELVILNMRGPHLFWIAHGPLLSLLSGLRQISELLGNRIVVADGLSLHRSMILDGELAKPRLQWLY